MPSKEMPHFHPLGVVEGDYLRVNASVLVACHVIATCDTNWGHSFSHPRRSQGCQNVAYHLKRKRKTRGEFTYALHTCTHTHLGSIRYRRCLHLPRGGPGMESMLGMQNAGNSISRSRTTCSESSSLAKIFSYLSISHSIPSLRMLFPSNV